MRICYVVPELTVEDGAATVRIIRPNRPLAIRSKEVRN